MPRTSSRLEGTSDHALAHADFDAERAQRRRYALAVAIVLVISAGLRLWQISTPPDYMFDEVYYAKDAKAIVDGRVKPKPPFRWEAGAEVSWPHPEMGKFAIAAGILLFGNKAIGWRLPAALAGLVLLGCVYPLARRLGLSRPWALLALVLAASDTLLIAQSRIATLDVFLAMWSVLCVLFVLTYVHRGYSWPWLLAAGAAGGMATATKWSGLYALAAAALVLVAAWVWPRIAPAAAPRWPAGARQRGDVALTEDAEGEGAKPESATPDGGARAEAPSSRRLLAKAGLLIAAFAAIPLAIYMLSYTQYFLVGHTWADFVELHRQMLTFNLHLEAKHTYASRPTTWIVDYRPVWYYFKTVSDTQFRGVVALGNPLLWWSACLALIATPILVLTRRQWILVPTALLILVLYLPWFATNRTSFFYYMTPVAPFLAILVAAGLYVYTGDREIPWRAWIALGVAALLAATLWLPVGHFFGSLFWGWPARVSTGLGAVTAAAGAVVAVALVALLFSGRLRRWRPYVALAAAGVIVGICIVFLPIIVNIPISKTLFYQMMWLPSWI